MKAVLSSRIIPKEQLSGIERWEPHSFARHASGPAPSAAVDAEARERGFRQGYADGCREGQAAAAEISAAESARLAMLLASASAGMSALGATVARDAVDLALAIARQVVRRELTIRPEVVVAAVQEALDCMPPGTRDAQLHLHPADAALVRSRIGDDLARSGWRVIEAEELSPGGCRISAASGDIDATLETRWTSVLAAIEASHDQHHQ